MRSSPTASNSCKPATTTDDEGNDLTTTFDSSFRVPQRGNADTDHEREVFLRHSHGGAAARSFEYAFRRQVVPAPHQPWAAPWPLHAVVGWRNERVPTRGRGPRRRRGGRQASGVRHALPPARSRSNMTAAVASTKRPEDGMASHLRDSFAAPVLPRPGARNPAHIQKVA